MALYAISDLHLSLSVNKPMDIFGGRWTDYMQKLEQHWRQTVSDEDYIIIPGDISWATYLSEAYEDFKFIDKLPGKKIISKGNHDYWWTTMNKLNKFLEDYGFLSINFMHNNSFVIDNYVVCGTRGWSIPGEQEFKDEDWKMFNRELSRLEISLKNTLNYSGKVIVAALHYPPFNSRNEPSEFVKVMKKYNVDICIYGHLHGESLKNVVEGKIENIEFKNVSADYLGFMPTKL